eukprot:2408616-Lingulodinium_polyedra.AAC.1
MDGDTPHPATYSAGPARRHCHDLPGGHSHPSHLPALQPGVQHLEGTAVQHQEGHLRLRA